MKYGMKTVCRCVFPVLLALLFCVGCTESTVGPGQDGETRPGTEENGTVTDRESEAETEPGADPVVPPAANSFLPTSAKAGRAFLDPAEIAESGAAHGMRKFYFPTQLNPGLPFSVACHISDGEISAMLPAGTDLRGLIPVFEGAELMVGGKAVRSGTDAIDLASPVNALVTDAAGKTFQVVLRVETLATGLPSVAVTVDGFGSIRSKEEYVSGTFYVGGGSKAVCPYAAEEPTSVGASFKGRGNTSWGFEKKGYTVKLDEKTDVLGLGKSKNYTLISNYQDKSLMRNEIAAYLSERLGLVTMKTRSVDLWLNGAYHGCYMVIEKVEIEKGRVDIPEDTDLPPEELGYLMEWDGHVSEVSGEQKNRWQRIGDTVYDPVADTYFMTSPGYLVIHKPSPEKMTEAHIAYITSLIKEADAAINARDAERIAKMLDLRSFAAWYLVEDLMKNMDARFWSSCYMYADGDGVLHMGPVWGFDMSLGNANYGGCDTPDGAYIEDCTWYRKLLKVPEFCAELSSLLSENREFLDAVPDYMDGYADMLERAQEMNFSRWKILDRAVGANPAAVVNEQTYRGQVEIAKTFYKRRLHYVRTSVSSFVRKAEEQSLAEEDLKKILPQGGTPIFSVQESVTSGRSLNISSGIGPLDLSGYREDGMICLTYRVADAGTITSDCQLELTSSGTCDREEINWGLSGEVLQDGGWRRAWFSVRECGSTGGKINWNAVNYFRIYVHVNAENTLEVADVRIYHEDELN